MDHEGLVRLSHRRQRRQKKLKRRERGWSFVRISLIGIIAVFLASVVASVFAFAYTYAKVSEDLPELDQYSATELAQTSVVYDSTGEVVDELHGVQNRFVVGLDEIDPSLRDAVVAIEDQRFYEHQGIDFEAIGRAAGENIASFSIRQGGSTITQQLVKNTYIAQEQRQVPSFQRKMTEASLAWQYEEGHEKDEILEQYLNTVYFGANAYGVEAAARTYYDKEAIDLTLHESALLAGIINLPGTYDPFSDPESAKARRDIVLDRMLEYGYITPGEHEEAVAQGLDLSRGTVETASENEYFLDAVRKELAEQYGDRALYEGGLKIYTTLDPRLQGLATEAVDKVVDPASDDPSASLVSVEPSTGAVKAMVGGSDFEEVKFNLATQGKRQPGSSFKTFVLAEAIRQGISPESGYASKDLNIDMGENAEPYRVQNYNYVERGPISIRTATEQSDNTVFVQLAMDLGLDKVAETANNLGIESALDLYPAMAIGGLGEGVSPLEMASSYSTFANSGTQMEPYLVERVTREEGEEEVAIQEHEPSGTEVLTRDQAAAITQTLRGVVDRGTAGRYRNLNEELGRPSAAKTGTTELFVDAWFVGYVPQLATSVWVGYPEERRPMLYVRGFPEVNGENFPLDIWSLYMQEAVRDLPVQELDKPSSDLKLQIKSGGRSLGKSVKETTREASFKAPSPSKEPQKPPVNAPPPPIYGRQQQLAATTPGTTPPASGQQQQSAPGQPQAPPIPPAPGQPALQPVNGQPQTASPRQTPAR
jgi:penicillin-binding protein 1A